MLQVPTKAEIDFRTMKLLVAIIALSLGPVVMWLATKHLPSISYAYCDGTSARNVFVGFLYAIAAIMIAHNGVNFRELVASKIAGVSAIGIAMWPTKECPLGTGFNPHYLCAAVMFTTLAWFCLSFYRRAEHKPHPLYAARRRRVYAACGVGIVGTMLVMGAIGQFDLWPNTNAILIFETIGLVLFGLSWLVASHVVPAFDHPSERMSLSVPAPSSESELHDPSVDTRPAALASSPTINGIGSIALLRRTRIPWCFHDRGLHWTDLPC